MSKHTPGPWHLSEETVRDGLRSKLIHGMPEGMLAVVRVEHQGNYYGDANARLIAAAPELLEALKEAMLALDGFAKGEGVFKPIEQTILTAEAAIAKAEG